MGRLPAEARVQLAAVSGRRTCGADAFVLEVELAEPLPPVTPGQFAMLSPGDGSGPLIPRPFSVYDQPAADRLAFLVQVLGPGTRALAELPPGGAVLCTAPLGCGFRVPAPVREVVLVAGGVGSAPFLLYGRRRACAGAGQRTRLFFGARTAARLYDREAFAAAGLSCVFATEDGKLGFAGNVVDCVAAALAAGFLPREALYCACGPTELLRAFAALARRERLQGEVSLETYMGCGFGVCNGCPVPTDPSGPMGGWPYAKACLDGPVFPLEALAL